MVNKKILVLGYFGFNNNQLCGQTVKTRNIYELLKDHENEIGEVIYFDTQVFKQSWINVFIMFWEISKCKKLIYLPAQNNFTYLFPIIYILSKLIKIEIVHVVVGSWLEYFLSNKYIHRYMLKNILVSLPQTINTCNIMNNVYNIKNVTPLNNFRINNHNFTDHELNFNKKQEIFKIVFMARINKLKGISYVFDLASKFLENDKNVTIDFFGQINPDDRDYFFQNVNQLKNVFYKGYIEPSNIYNKLSEYDVLVLPTYFPDEGFPGSILDAYIAGIPVIVSNWKELPKFVEIGKSGYVVDLNNMLEMYNYCVKLYENPELLFQMKKFSNEKSKEYSSDRAWEILKVYI